MRLILEAVLLLQIDDQKGIKLNTLDWTDNQLFEIDKIKEVPSWIEKGTNLLHKKVGYLISILSLSAEPISLNEMMSFIGYKNRKAFRDEIGELHAAVEKLNTLIKSEVLAFFLLIKREVLLFTFRPTGEFRKLV